VIFTPNEKKAILFFALLVTLGSIAKLVDKFSFDSSFKKAEFEQKFLEISDSIKHSQIGKDTIVSNHRIDLNLATESDLIKLPRIGIKTAERIIEVRDSKGKFDSVDDLLEIPGIGEKTIKPLRELLFVRQKKGK